MFASDALSSVAYAPDEILLTLGIAGFAAYSYSWKVGLAVALVMLVVVASYRQNVHAYPSGGGDYEVATVNLGRDAGPDRGERPARRLRADRRGVDLLGRAVRGLDDRRRSQGHEVTVAVVAIVLLMAVNLRGVRESGDGVRDPDLRVHGRASSGWRLWGFFRLAFGDLPDVESAPFTLDAEASTRHGITGLAGAFLLLRAFSSGCAALTGVEAISNGVPAFRKPKSKNAATTLLLLGTIAVTMLLASSCWPRSPACGSPRTSSSSCGSTASRACRRAAACSSRTGVHYAQDPVIGQLAKRLRQRAADGRRRDDGHRADPGARRQHRLQRLPGARLDPRPGPLPAPAAAHPRRPARLQQRHHHPGGVRDPADRRVRRRGDPADPALHRRRVRLVHPQPDRHGPALDPAAADRDGPGEAAPDEAQPGHQRASACR